MAQYLVDLPNATNFISRTEGTVTIYQHATPSAIGAIDNNTLLGIIGKRYKMGVTVEAVKGSSALTPANFHSVIRGVFSAINVKEGGKTEWFEKFMKDLSESGNLVYEASVLNTLTNLRLGVQTKTVPSVGERSRTLETYARSSVENLRNDIKRAGLGSISLANAQTIWDHMKTIYFTQSATGFSSIKNANKLVYEDGVKEVEIGNLGITKVRAAHFAVPVKVNAKPTRGGKIKDSVDYVYLLCDNSGAVSFDQARVLYLKRSDLDKKKAAKTTADLSKKLNANAPAKVGINGIRKTHEGTGAALTEAENKLRDERDELVRKVVDRFDPTFHRTLNLKEKLLNQYIGRFDQLVAEGKIRGLPQSNAITLTEFPTLRSMAL
jgi:hypothetical protein